MFICTSGKGGGKLTREEKRNIVIRAAISVLVIGAIIGVGYLVLYIFGLTDIRREQIQEFVNSAGALAPIVFILISFLQVTFIPIPSTVTVLAGAYVFGALPSFFYSYIGINLGAIVAFELGRGLGRPFARWVAGSEETLNLWIGKLKGRENALLWIMFFCPFFPDDTLCAVAGMFKISRIEFLAMQLITRMTSIGSTLLIMSGEIIPYEGWGLIVLSIVAVLFVAMSILALIYYEKLTAFVYKVIGRFKKGKPDEPEATEENLDNK